MNYVFRMPGAKWTNDDQHAFLTTWIPEYTLAQQSNRFDRFWPKLCEAWFTRWPETQPAVERATDAPETLEDLEKKALASALQSRKKVRTRIQLSSKI
jgi:hypothetical protein